MKGRYVDRYINKKREREKQREIKLYIVNP